jgi:hypothetical protein
MEKLQSDLIDETDFNESGDDAGSVAAVNHKTLSLELLHAMCSLLRCLLHPAMMDLE